MRKLFSHENRIIVFNLRNVLEGEGIDTHVVNEFAAGGAGDLPTFDTWPELWLEDETCIDEAEAILREILEQRPGSEWYCRGCQELNDGAFQVCWKCGRASE